MDDTISDGKEFDFRARNVDGMVKSFDYWLVVDMDMSYRYSNIILDASIHYYECIGQRIRGFNC